MTQERTVLDFQRKRRRRTIALVTGAVLMFVGASAVGQIFGDRYGMITLLLVVIGVLVFIWRDWRCPACGRSLSPEFRSGDCPHCGAHLTP